MKKTVPIKEQFAFLRFLRPALEKSGVQYDGMMEVLALKATILLRTEAGALPARKAKKNNTTATAPAAAPEPAFLSPARNLQSFIIAFCMAAVSLAFKDPVSMLALVFIPGFLMQLLRVITTFPVLILDTKDVTLLATQPIGTRTVAAAKTILVILYLCTESLALYTVALVPFMIKGYFTVIPGMLIAIALANLLSVVLVYLLYGFVLRFYDGEKLKDLITILQIILSVVVVAASQLISRMTALISPDSVIRFSWWHLAIPPLGLCWIANLFNFGKNTVPALASLATMLALIFTHFFFTASLVDKNLGKLLREGEKKRYLHEFGKKATIMLAHVFFRDSASRAFFIFSSSIVENDRKLKQLLYPTLASALVFPAIILFSSWQRAKVPISLLFQKAPLLILMLYLFTLSTVALVNSLKRCEKPAGSWFFGILPVTGMQRPFRAAGLVFLLKFMAGPLVLASLPFFALAGKEIFPHLLAVNLCSALVGLIQLGTLKPAWPHSSDLMSVEPRTGRNYIMMIALVFLVAGFHAAAYLVMAEPGLYLLAGLSLAGITVLWLRLGHEGRSSRSAPMAA